MELFRVASFPGAERDRESSGREREEREEGRKKKCFFFSSPTSSEFREIGKGRKEKEGFWAFELRGVQME